MPRDLQGLMHRTEVLVKTSKNLCDGAFRAIKKSKRLIEASRSGANGDARKSGPVNGPPLPVAQNQSQERR